MFGRASGNHVQCAVGFFYCTARLCMGRRKPTAFLPVSGSQKFENLYSILSIIFMLIHYDAILKCLLQPKTIRNVFKQCTIYTNNIFLHTEGRFYIYMKIRQIPFPANAAVLF